MQAQEKVLTLSHAEAASIETHREARRAAMFVAAFVGVPAAVAAGATILLSALTAIVLLAPVVAGVLTWVAWRYGREDAAAPRR
jgi:heme/copper-type cytochrome/quinol oxidase subunit 2